MDANLLRSKMALKGHKDIDLARVLGIASSAVSKKLRQDIKMSQIDIQKIINEYALTPEETTAIFFTESLS